MSNIMFGNPWMVDNATVTASDEDADHPVTNVQTMQPAESWRSTSNPTGTTYIYIDLGTSRTMDYVAILGHNATRGAGAVVVNIGDTKAEVDGTPDYTTGSKLLAYSSWSNHHQYFNAIIEFPSITKRWIRLAFSDSGNADGYLEIGRIYVGNKLTPNVNLDYGWDAGLLDPTIQNRTLGGVTVPTARRMAKTLEFRLAFQTKDQLYGFRDSWLGRGLAKDYLVAIDPDMTNTRFMDWALYGVMTDFYPIINTSYGLYEQRFTIEELL